VLPSRQLLSFRFPVKDLVGAKPRTCVECHVVGAIICTFFIAPRASIAAWPTYHGEAGCELSPYASTPET
jgi:hypothetical protein